MLPETVTNVGDYLSKKHIARPVALRLCGNTRGEKDSGEITCVDQLEHHSNFYFFVLLYLPFSVINTFTFITRKQTNVQVICKPQLCWALHLQAQISLLYNFCCFVLPSISDLQAELKEVLALRKQLEQDVLAYRNLQKALQEELSEIQRREGTHAFLWLSFWLFYVEDLD